MQRLKRFINTASYLLIAPVLYVLSFVPVMAIADQCGVVYQASYVYYPLLRVVPTEMWGSVLQLAGVSDVAVFFLVNLYTSFAAILFPPF